MHIYIYTVEGAGEVELVQIGEHLLLLALELVIIEDAGLAEHL